MGHRTVRLLTASAVTRDQFRPSGVKASRRRVEKAAGSQLKRILDITGASLAIIALSPLLICVALMVWVTSPGPVFYGHQRIGQGGRPFKCWKFRSMILDSERALARHLANSPTARQEWHETRKLRDDPRITSIGQTLRATSLDELPQLFNVLLGDMSLVGPRPVVKDELALYGRSARYYLRARPGITGLWQVSGRSETAYSRRVALDRAYVKNAGFLMDLSILLRTVPVVLKARGSW
ncbi:sugar transferase [Phaeovulum sp.]|uniref:sugar transferase n=1 Tax=Phaeovulum sp. TaxID=2934796 RepID=UPI0039E6DC94